MRQSKCQKETQVKTVTSILIYSQGLGNLVLRLLSQKCDETFYVLYVKIIYEERFGIPQDVGIKYCLIENVTLTNVLVLDSLDRP